MSRKSEARRCREFNEEFPVGTTVEVQRRDGSTFRSTTRSIARLANDVAVICVVGEGAEFSLSRITVKAPLLPSEQPEQPKFVMIAGWKKIL